MVRAISGLDPQAEAARTRSPDVSRGPSPAAEAPAKKMRSPDCSSRSLSGKASWSSQK
ncbi:MAG: hypothetical protein LBF74_06560 [Treponema sp.]|nr:hypothetical protein [Treponema sp.]